jgi:IS30 family transposase
MPRPDQRVFSEEFKQELWERRKAGEPLREIGKVLGAKQTVLWHVVAASGGIPQPMRRRASRALSFAEREEISRGIAAGLSIRTIAASLHRAPSTVSREVKRNRGRRGYRAARADRRAWRQARRPKACLLARNRRLRQLVADKLALDWSPEQICGWLRLQYPHDEEMSVSPETIYRSLFVQARGVLKRELLGHLRSNQLIRRSRKAKAGGHGNGQIVDAISIRERPPEAEDRAIPGHWEGDLIAGTQRSHIATLVERHSRFTMLVRLSNRNTETVVKALSRQVKKLPLELRRSLTWDRGHEMALHKAFTVATNVQVYFCDPRSPWQRGTNENTNRLLRQYFPKGADVSEFSQEQLNKVAMRLNQRPRKTLGFKTPAEKLEAVLP